MANNTITVTFDPCEPAPPLGYRLLYRPLGSVAGYRITAAFAGSPIVVVDTLDPEGTEYEGFIQGVCGPGKYGVLVPWQTSPQESQSGSASLSVSESEGESESEPESVSDFYQYAVSAETICSEFSNLLYSATPFGPGVTMYLEPSLINPLTGYNLIMSSFAGAIRFINSGTGVVGGLSGDSC